MVRILEVQKWGSGRLSTCRCPQLLRGSIQWPQSHHDQKERYKVSFLENEDRDSLPVISKCGWLLKSSNNNKDSSFPSSEILLQQIWLGPSNAFSQRSLGDSDDLSGLRSINCACALPSTAPGLNQDRRQTRNLRGTLAEHPPSGETTGWHANLPPPLPPHTLGNVFRLSSGLQP